MRTDFPRARKESALSSRDNRESSIVEDSGSPKMPGDFGGMFRRFGRFLDNRGGAEGKAPPLPPSNGAERPNSMRLPSVGGGTNGSSGLPRGSSSRPPIPDPQAQVTPTDNIKTNVLRAVQASRPDRTDNVVSNMQTKTVKESESSYCDPAASADLVYCLDVEGLRFFVSKDAPDAELVVSQHGAAVRRFITQIIKPLCRVYDLAPRTCQVFYDLAGPLIAFKCVSSCRGLIRLLTWSGLLVAMAPSISDCATTSAGVRCRFSLLMRLSLIWINARR